MTAPPVPARLGDRSFVLHERARRYTWTGMGSLSIKSFRGGRAVYEVGGGRYAVDDRTYLVLNQGTPYTIEFDADAPVESFCVFFEDGLADDVLRSLTAGTGRLLDEPQPDASSLQFFERTYPHDGLLSPALFRLRDDPDRAADDRLWLDERLRGLASRLLAAHELVRRETQRLHAERAGTREELYRRLHRARDYVEACYEEPLRLDQLASVACLSTNHFLRTFRQAFGRTPHQYLMERRLQRARELLSRTELAVTEVCLSVGFESLGSFSRLFRRRFGTSPVRIRARKR
jgi:AraC-like DNA-binding protein